MSRMLVWVVATFTLVGAITAFQVASGVAQEASPAASPSAQTEVDLLRQIELDRLQDHITVEMDPGDYAPEFRHINPAGQMIERDEYLERVATGEYVYRVLDPVTELEVRLCGDGAVITYQDQVDLMDGDRHLAATGWHTIVYEKRDGRWVIVWSQTTQTVG